MFIKKRYLVLIAVALVLAAFLFMFSCINPFGLSGMDDFLKLCTGIGAIKSHYYEEIDDSSLVDGALSGAAYSTMDPWTVYMPKDTADDFLEDVNADDYSGVGLYISNNIEDNTVMVVSPLSESPGEKAGIVTGDKILKVDGEDVYGENIDEVAEKMKGEEGTEVKLTVLKKETGKEVEITLVREVIKIETVEKKMLDDKIGVLDISQFGVNTFDEFADHFNSLLDEGMEKLIIDLRNNPGGYMDIAIEIADAFMDEGNIVYTMDRGGRKSEYNAHKGSTKIPIAILVNGGSASASEILTGALKDHNLAFVVGEKSFGKGVTQIPYMFFDESIMKITNSRYYTPSGKCIDKEGIMPDFEVVMDSEKNARISSLSLEEDDQLLKAIEVLKQNDN